MGREGLKELGMTVSFGTLSSLAQRNHQASFGHRQMVGPGGDSGPPSLPEMSPCLAASQLPPAAGNMRPRCSILGTTVPGLPRHQAGFVCGSDNFLDASDGGAVGRGGAKGRTLLGQEAVASCHREGAHGQQNPEWLAWCWIWGLEPSDRNPSLEEGKVGVPHQTLGAHNFQLQILLPRLCPSIPWPGSGLVPPPFIQSLNKYLLSTYCVPSTVPGTRKISVTEIDQQKKTNRASLVAQWLRICLPMQGTQVQALVREDPTYRGATKLVRHSY